MKISLAQIRSIAGDIERNIENHLYYVGQAVAEKSEIVVFPELSITGYEPTLADGLSINENDTRIQVFQSCSDRNNIIIGIGAPFKGEEGTSISMIIFHPNQPRQIYHKTYLHPDEAPFFVSKENDLITIRGTEIALAICYEISVMQHQKDMLDSGASIYLASVAKHAKGVKDAANLLSKMAKEHSVGCLMVNSIGSSDNFMAYGNSEAWDRSGRSIKKLGSNEEGLLCVECRGPILV